MNDRLSLRLSFFYCAIFTVIGIQLPFWPLYLSDKGLDPTAIGLLLACAYLAKIISNPVIGHHVDRRGDRRRPLLLLAMISSLALALFAPFQGFSLLLIITLIHGGAFSAMMPLADSLTMLCSVSHRLDYGRVRLWGSLSFIAASGIGGLTLVEAAPSAIFWSLLCAQLLLVGSCALLPDLRISAPDDGKDHPPFLRSRPFIMFLTTTSCLQVSHVIYYAFATLHWRAAGLSGGIIGALWGEGVIAEVALFAFGGGLVLRLGPRWLMVAAGAAGILRWSVLAASTDPWILASVQMLHALTFGATHLGAMHFINRSAPPHLSARAQSTYSSVTVGLAPGLGMLAAGPLYQNLGGEAFLLMSGLAAIGLGLALNLRNPAGHLNGTNQHSL